jgi:lipopolysaccharide export system permease protein
MVGLFSALGGQFRRHGNVLRPLVTIVSMVALLAVGLAVGTIAARDNRMICLLYIHALLPGLVCLWLLLLPSLHGRSQRARPIRHALPAHG